jgi:uncharacterized protein
MKIGLIADTHDNIVKTRIAVQKFNELSVKYVIHAGDIISPFTANIFNQLESKFISVYGNNDGDKQALLKTIQPFGVIKEPPHFTNIEGLRFCIIHDQKLIQSIANKHVADVIIFGHLHKSSIEKRNCLIINPGECCGYLSGKSTIAILETSTMVVEILEI